MPRKVRLRGAFLGCTCTGSPRLFQHNEENDCLSWPAFFSLCFSSLLRENLRRKTHTPALLPETSTQASVRLKWYSAVRSCIHARHWLSQHQVSTRQVARTPLPSKHKSFQRDIRISGGNHNPDSDLTEKMAKFQFFFGKYLTKERVSKSLKRPSCLLFAFFFF